MNYSDNEGMCRVEVFRGSGKWYLTTVIDMYYAYDEIDLYNTVRRLTRDALDGRCVGMWAVCLDPYHKNGYPVMVQL